MAWFMRQRAETRWRVGADTVPDGRELHARREAFRKTLSHGAHGPNVPVYNRGMRLPVDLFPTAATIDSDTLTPPDMIVFSIMGLSQRLKSIFERYEPGVHQFVEVPTKLQDGSQTLPYYATVITQLAYNQVDYLNTTASLDEEGKIYPLNHDDDGRVTLRRTETAEWHAWQSVDVYSYLTVSERLKDAIEAEGIPGFRFTFANDIM